MHVHVLLNLLRPKLKFYLFSPYPTDPEKRALPKKNEKLSKFS